MENEELGRRAVACKHWRWMPGMLTQTGDRIVLVEDDGTAYFRETFIGTCPIDEDAVPDISDPATIGCLLQLVREAWGHDYIIVLGGWTHVHIYPRERAEEAWALVAALGAAP